MTATTFDQEFDAERQERAAKAAAILRENRPPTAAARSALDTLDAQAWILWHTDDLRRGVVTLLDRAGLLRDLDAEKADRERHAASHAALGPAATPRERALIRLLGAAVATGRIKGLKAQFERAMRVKTEADLTALDDAPPATAVADGQERG